MSNILDSLVVKNTATNEEIEYELQDKGARAQIAANVAASTDSNANYAAEVADARVGSDGTTYPSLGDALRSTDRQTRELQSAFEKEVDYNKKAIDELTNKKITKFYTNSLGATSLLDSDKGKTSDMKIYGKSEQNQYTGKNLINPTLETTTKSGLTCTNNGDGTFTFTGGFTGTDHVWFLVQEFTLQKGQKVKVVGCPSGGGSGSYRMTIRHSIDTEGTKYEDGNGAVFTANETEKHKIYMSVELSTISTPLVFKPMLVDAEKYPDVTYDDFEPYVGGVPAPNPDYPQTINSVGDDGSLVVTSCGKNLFNANTLYKSYNYNGITCTLQSDGSLKLIGTSTDVINMVMNKFTLKAGTYTYSTPGRVKAGFCLYSTTDQKFIAFNAKTFTLDKDSVLDIRVQFAASTDVDEIVYTQFEVGEVATEYEPYHETTTTIPLSTPLRAIGDVKDEITYQGGKWGVLRRIEKVVLDGSDDENWKLGAADNFNDVSFTAYTDSLKPIHFIGAYKSIPSLCDKFIDNRGSVYANTITHECYSVARGDAAAASKVGRFSVRLLKSRISEISVAEVKAWLSSNPITLAYELAEPVFEPFEDQTLQYDLITYKGVTTIMTDDELSPEVVVDYPVSMEKGWEYIKQQLGDTREYVYDMDLQSAQAYINSEYAVALTELGV